MQQLLLSDTNKRSYKLMKEINKLIVQIVLKIKHASLSPLSFIENVTP
jgi:hypothetical protein